jgi:enoyl-CoA hydratase
MIIEKKSEIGFITFDRPEAMNAINSTVLAELEKAIDDFENDKNIRLIIFTGKGKSFIAGADLDEMMNLRGLEAKRFSERGVKLFRRIENLSLPTISVINGYCLGGGFEFALCTDIRIAGERASFAFPEAGLGITPGFSGTQRLPRAIGQSKAKELMFTGRRIKAQEAHDLGLVSAVYSQDELMNKSIELAESILANSSMAIGYIKKAINMGMDLNMDAALELETGLAIPIFGSKDQMEGASAFKEKRKPNFGE